MILFYLFLFERGAQRSDVSGRMVTIVSMIRGPFDPAVNARG